MTDLPLQDWSRQTKALARNFGFDFVGISKAERLDEEAKQLEQWLNKGQHGEMSWMENHFEKRVDPRKLVPGAQSVVSLMANYFPGEEPMSSDSLKIARYAYGQDYHNVLRKKLRSLLAAMEQAFDRPIHGRCFTDSAPVMEREWAKRSGLGWIGKNTLLIHPRAGSYFFLAELIIDLPLLPDTPISDHCGRCRRCIDACPTDAIAEKGYTLDASKCISYLTIELKDDIPVEFKGKMEDWIFGCDICQEVCPWNRFSKPHNEPAFDPPSALSDMSRSDWADLTEEVFQKLFKKSAVKRTKYAGLKRNIRFVLDEEAADTSEGNNSA
jgi:epoxyqueuosine reductase